MPASAVDAYLKEQPAEKRALLEKLRGVVVSALPDATVSIKWGVPTYQLNGRNVCALASFRRGKTSRMLKVRTASDVDAASIKRWLKAASQ